MMLGVAGVLGKRQGTCDSTTIPPVTANVQSGRIECVSTVWKINGE